MATDATIQVLDSAVETAGVSTVTATNTVANPRNGIIYNPATFAAGVPVWFHRRQDGKYLAVFKKIWTAATGVYNNGPQLFSTETEVTTPTYVIIDPTTGTCDGPYDLGTMATLNTAVSRDDYLFVLGTKGGAAWIQHFVLNRAGNLILQGEEEVPLGYNLGLYIDKRQLHVFGADVANHLARVRKNWGRIGTSRDPNAQWEVEGALGWFATDYLDNVVPMPPGTIPASGPCSVAKFKDRLYLMVTEHIAGAYDARVYYARAVDAAWKPLSATVIPLGADALYMGGSAYLQPHLVANRVLLPDGAQTGFPYVTSTKIVSAANEGILTEWGLLAV